MHKENLHKHTANCSSKRQLNRANCIKQITLSKLHKSNCTMQIAKNKFHNENFNNKKGLSWIKLRSHQDLAFLKLVALICCIKLQRLNTSIHNPELPSNILNRSDHPKPTLTTPYHFQITYQSNQSFTYRVTRKKVHLILLIFY